VSTPDAAQTVPRSEFLEGMSVVSPGFNTWRATEQARLAALALRLLAEICRGRAPLRRRGGAAQHEQSDAPEPILSQDAICPKIPDDGQLLTLMPYDGFRARTCLEGPIIVQLTGR